MTPTLNNWASSTQRCGTSEGVAGLSVVTLARRCGAAVVWAVCLMVAGAGVHAQNADPPPSSTLAGVAGRAAHGVAFWADGEDRRILSLRNSSLYALDARSGQPVAAFGDGGRVDLTPNGARVANGGASPIVVSDVVVVAGTVDGAGDSGVRWKGSLAENVRGYDVRTGALRWTFHVVPRPGKFGAETTEGSGTGGY